MSMVADTQFAVNIKKPHQKILWAENMLIKLQKAIELC